MDEDSGLNPPAAYAVQSSILWPSATFIIQSRAKAKGEMMSHSTNIKKAEQLGMPIGTAANRLRKIVLFETLKRHNENICFRCGRMIEAAKDLSLDHKIGWMDTDVTLFWDIDNIAFSHLSCNSTAINHFSPAKLQHQAWLKARATLPEHLRSQATIERRERLARRGK